MSVYADISMSYFHSNFVTLGAPYARRLVGVNLRQHAMLALMALIEPYAACLFLFVLTWPYQNVYNKKIV